MLFKKVKEGKNNYMNKLFYLLTFTAILAGGWTGWHSRPLSKKKAVLQAVTAVKVVKIKRYTGIEKMIADKFGSDASIAIAVAKSESGLKCDAIGDNGDSIGLFQINRVHFWRFNKLAVDCEDNIRVAKEIYDEQGGFQAWTAFTNGSFRNFL